MGGCLKRLSRFQNRLLELYFTPSEDQVGVGLLPLLPAPVEDHVENEINPEQNQNYPEETQEHLEICKGTDHERRGLNMSKWQGIQKSG